MGLQDGREEVIRFTANGLFAKTAAYHENVSDYLLTELLSQAVLPLAHLEDAPEWQRRSSAVIASNMQISYEHTELHGLLSENHIPYVILKGVASASYYPDPILRTMGDVDFLIRPTDVTKATALVESIGFVSEGDTGGKHIVFHRDSSVWEMHRCVNGVPENDAGKIIRTYLSDTIDTAVDYDEGNGIVKIPDSFHHGLILLLHTASHLTSEGVGLRHLCDWAVFVNHFTDEQFRFLFEEKLKACGLWRFAQLLSLVSAKYLKLPYQSWMGEAEDTILEQLITDIMDGGNFGNKDGDRYRQIKYISNRGEHTVDQKSALRQLWDTIGKKAKAANASRISVIADYARMVVSGERKLDLSLIHI